MTTKTPEHKVARALKLGAEGLTQQEIAESTGLGRSTVAHLEIRAGRRRRSARGSFADAATGFEHGRVWVCSSCGKTRPGASPWKLGRPARCPACIARRR